MPEVSSAIAADRAQLDLARRRNDDRSEAQLADPADPPRRARRRRHHRVLLDAQRRKHSDEPACQRGNPVERSTTAAPPPSAASAACALPQPAAPSAPRPDAIAADLERSLKKQRLWSTVNIVGDHVDIRSGSCGDPAMKSSLELVAGTFKAAGLTKLRCVEQSGSLVFDRDL